METRGSQPPNPQLDRVATLLEGQIAETHSWVMSLFRYAGNEDKPLPMDVQFAVMNAATRLMQANTSAALALKRLHGTESRHTVEVREGDTPAQNLKTNGNA
jgi:hypothetical protein